MQLNFANGQSLNVCEPDIDGCIRVLIRQTKLNGESHVQSQLLMNRDQAVAMAKTIATVARPHTINLKH